VSTAPPLDAIVGRAGIGSKVTHEPKFIERHHAKQRERHGKSAGLFQPCRLKTAAIAGTVVI
jgi:hypothetical protein